MTTTLQAPIPYLGGKRSMAPRIVDLLTAKGDPKHYIEPFHGSAAVLCEVRRRFPKCPAIACDKHALVHNLFKVLSDPDLTAQLVAMLSYVSFHEAHYRCSVASVEHNTPGEEPDPTLAAQYLMASWMGPNDRTGSADDPGELVDRFCKRYNTSGGDPSVRWMNVKASIEEWHKLLCDRTTFILGDGIDLLCKTRQHDREGLCVYVDPPYLQDTRDAKTRYAHEIHDNTGGFLEHDDDHYKLAAVLRGYEHAHIVISYYAHERLARLYPPDQGWTHIDAPCNKQSANTNTPGGTTAGEVLIATNR